MQQYCFHCGDHCETSVFREDDRIFCCRGCQSVYVLFKGNGLLKYYDLEGRISSRPDKDTEKYRFLDNPEITEKLLDFQSDNRASVTLHIPAVHCSSCIWLLENLHKLDKGVLDSTVNFPKKEVRIVFDTNLLTLKTLVYELTGIGYEPYISLAQSEGSISKSDNSLIYKLGVAGFAFGNVMLLSFPEYFEWNEYWLNQYKPFFRTLMLLLSIPVVFYAGNDYFTAAWKGIKNRYLNIDIPIALGLVVLFSRSAYEVLSATGQGFFDSLTGLVFFLLLGRYFQQRTYHFLSFERDYRSYFPLGVTRITSEGKEESVEVRRIAEGDILLIRNGELIPADAVLESGSAEIDYSFVTGESYPVRRRPGDRLFAGGKQQGEAIEIRVVKSVSQSYLTQLWGHASFEKNKEGNFENLTDRVSRYFTPVILGISLIAALWWAWQDPSKIAPVVTSVLIIACPCALALSAPFTQGNLLRWFGQKGFYLKNAQVLERMGRLDTIVFDKTGTLTSADRQEITYEGMALQKDEEQWLKSTLRNSNHPLSRQLYQLLKANDIEVPDTFIEIPASGLEASFGNQIIRVGSGKFLGVPSEAEGKGSSVYVSSGRGLLGRYRFSLKYREGMANLFHRLKDHFQLAVLSGDTTSEETALKKLIGFEMPMFFKQMPEDKLEYIAFHQKAGRKVMMVGDGLNDAGALKESTVGVAVSENVNVFSPACDAILSASELHRLDRFLRASRQGMRVIYASMGISFLYNIVGLAFAVSGHLSPVIAAILMPLSSISVVAFTTLATNAIARKI